MAPAPDRRGVRAALGRPARPQPLARRLLRGRARAGGRASSRSSSTTSTRPSRRSAGPPKRASRAACCCPAPRRAPGCRSCTRRRTTRSGRSARSSACRSTTTRGVGLPAAGRRTGRPRGVHGRDDLVLAPRPVAPDLRRRLPPPPGPAAGADRAGLRLDPRRARHAGLLPRAPGRGGRRRLDRRVQVRRGRSPTRWARALARYWRDNCFVGASFMRPPRGAAARPDRRRQDHVGQRLPARRGHVPVLPRGPAHRVRGRAARRGRAPWSAATRPASTASTSTPLDPIAAKVGPTVAEIAEPLARPPADATSPVFARGRRYGCGDTRGGILPG